MGDYTFDAVTQGAEMRVTGHSQFKAAELNIDGNVQLRGDWPTTVNFHFNRLDVDSVIRTYLKRRVTGQSAVAGDLQLRGPLRRPRELEVMGNFNDLFADVDNKKARNNGPISFTISHQFLSKEIVDGTNDLLFAGIA